MFSFYSTNVETEDTNLRLLNTAVTKIYDRPLQQERIHLTAQHILFVE